ncbi:glycosyltransferase [Pseudidiomarina andamanensis]|uniref:glycosyltransferase n=1 Tax=Pseudidiomarina andamanensis TaxID=1940690 RepID=UPI001566EB2C|nr:glycosyltransferase [Pseudidiomarina andamanensis]MDS0217757.1 glycosyltransferase [Pseudidiomarina andamanensis]
MELKDYKNIVSSQLPSEEEIIASWGDTVDNPIVTISCTTFNQEAYIEDAIISFLRQKTEFPYEILVHDDASTDKTKEIILRYELLYPKIVKPLYQSVNQYSQGKKPSLINLKRANGKYIALCEGDDFWVDSNKLSIQVNVLERNMDIDLCFTEALCGKSFDDGIIFTRLNPITDSRVSFENVLTADGGLMPTASLMFRRSKTKLIEQVTEGNPPVVDYFLQVATSFPNGAIFIPQVTCFYRVNSIGSWSVRSKHEGLDETFKNLVSYISCVVAFKDKLGLEDDFDDLLNIKVLSRIDKAARKAFIMGSFCTFKRILKLRIGGYPNIKFQLIFLRGVSNSKFLFDMARFAYRIRRGLYILVIRRHSR